MKPWAGNIKTEKQAKFSFTKRIHKKGNLNSVLMKVCTALRV